MVPVEDSPILSLGETPHWDPETLSCYFIDAFGTDKILFRYDWKSGKVYSASIPGETRPSIMIPIKGKKNLFAVGIYHKLKVVQWDGVSATAKVVRTVFEIEKGCKNSTKRFSDGKVDRKGRFYFGTIREEVN